MGNSMKEANLIQYKILTDSFGKFRKQLKQLYIENINDPLWSDKLRKYVDYRPLYSSKSFKKYKSNISKEIFGLLGSLDSDRFKQICEVYSDSFDVQELDLNVIGTTLNMLREFFRDFQLTLLANKI